MRHEAAHGRRWQHPTLPDGGTTMSPSVEGRIRYYAGCWEWQVGPERGFTHTRRGALRVVRSALKRIDANSQPLAVSDWEVVR